MVVLVVGLVSTLLVIDVSSLLMSGGFGHPGHLVNHLLSVFFLRKDGDGYAYVRYGDQKERSAYGFITGVGVAQGSFVASDNSVCVAGDCSAQSRSI